MTTATVVPSVVPSVVLPVVPCGLYQGEPTHLEIALGDGNCHYLSIEFEGSICHFHPRPALNHLSVQQRRELFMIALRWLAATKPLVGKVKMNLAVKHNSPLIRAARQCGFHYCGGRNSAIDWEGSRDLSRLRCRRQRRNRRSATSNC